jgi:class 3 adenylate cyclase/FixJ family two-component response regulator
VKRYGLLIVDDEKDILRILTLTFEEDYEVFTASSGAEALQILEQEEIALIIADQRMPEMTGVEFLERTIEKHPHIIRMLLTGYTDTVALIQAINAGRVYRYITKPWDRAELKLTVKRALESYELALENARLVKELEAENTRLQETLHKVELLEHVRRHLSVFVPESVKRIIEENPIAPVLEKQEKDVSILFLDIIGYTRLSESMDYAKVGYLVERYFSSFLEDIYSNHGDINETAGDGLMMIFQEDDKAMHAIEAVRTAIGIQRKTARINDELRGIYEPIGVRIGINSGSAHVGASKFQGITGTRWTFTASGFITNLAARLASLAPSGEVYIGRETADRVGSYFEVEPLGEQRLRNVERPVAIFRVIL